MKHLLFSLLVISSCAVAGDFPDQRQQKEKQAEKRIRDKEKREEKNKQLAKRDGAPKWYSKQNKQAQ